jgi:hypothetical protein
MSNGPGRARVGARRAIIAGGGQCTTREAMAWIWPRRKTFTRTHYTRTRKALREFCEPVRYERRGRCSTTPGGLTWLARGPIERAETRLTGGRLWWQAENPSAATDDQSNT